VNTNLEELAPSGGFLGILIDPPWRSSFNFVLNKNNNNNINMIDDSNQSVNINNNDDNNNNTKYIIEKTVTQKDLVLF
jgi:hypothetical protein